MKAKSTFLARNVLTSSASVHCNSDGERPVLPMPADGGNLGSKTSAIGWMSVQNEAPSVGAVDVARTKFAAFQIAKLVEHEQWMVAAAAEVAVVGGALLIAMGRADATVHVKHDCLGRMLRVHKVDPLP